MKIIESKRASAARRGTGRHEALRVRLRGAGRGEEPGIGIRCEKNAREYANTDKRKSGTVLARAHLLSVLSLRTAMFADVWLLYGSMANAARIRRSASCLVHRAPWSRP